MAITEQASYNDSLDHPIHPPPSSLKSHFDMEKPPAANYVIKAFKGVFQVYLNAEAANRGECFNYTYPVMKQYLDDVNKMCTMISNGPL